MASEKNWIYNFATARSRGRKLKRKKREEAIRELDALERKIEGMIELTSRSQDRILLHTELFRIRSSRTIHDLK